MTYRTLAATADLRSMAQGGTRDVPDPGIELFLTEWFLFRIRCVRGNRCDWVSSCVPFTR